LATEFLQKQGYRLVEKNYHTPRGEIDLIMWNGDVLVFVEVRSVSTLDHGHPLETITRPKQLRIVSAASLYTTKLSEPWPEMRFDAVGILLVDPPEFTLVKGAFET
jgi:putative endonuclease